MAQTAHLVDHIIPNVPVRQRNGCCSYPSPCACRALLTRLPGAATPAAGLIVVPWIRGVRRIAVDQVPATSARARRLLQAEMGSRNLPTASLAHVAIDVIRIVGARENNLRNVSVDIPKKQITVFTGV